MPDNASGSHGESLTDAVNPTSPTAPSQSPWLRFGVQPALLTALLVVADQITKELVVRDDRLSQYGSYILIPDILDLVHVRNKGAAWGMFSDYTWVLALISAAVAAYIIWQFRALAENRLTRGIALTVLLGGVIGNLIDRALRPHGVIDFVRIHYRDVFDYPAFNVADSAVCTSIAVLILTSVLPKRRPPEPSTAP